MQLLTDDCCNFELRGVLLLNISCNVTTLSTAVKISDNSKAIDYPRVLLRYIFVLCVSTIWFNCRTQSNSIHGLGSIIFD